MRRDFCFYSGLPFKNPENMWYICGFLFLCFVCGGRKFMSQFRIQTWISDRNIFINLLKVFSLGSSSLLCLWCKHCSIVLMHYSHNLNLNNLLSFSQLNLVQIVKLYKWWKTIKAIILITCTHMNSSIKHKRANLPCECVSFLTCFQC